MSKPSTPVTARAINPARSGGSVNVYVLTDDHQSTDALLVADMFDDPVFKVHVTEVRTPAGMSEPTREWHTIRNLLDHSQRNGDGWVVIIKDSSVTNASPPHVAKTIDVATKLDNADIMYLCKWLDRCDEHTEQEAIADTTMRLVRTRSPHGIQALLLSPRGREMLLGTVPLRDGTAFTYKDGEELSDVMNLVAQKDQMRVRATMPNLFDFNMGRMRGPEDLVKAQQCWHDGRGSSPGARTTSPALALTAPPAAATKARPTELLAGGWDDVDMSDFGMPDVPTMDLLPPAQHGTTGRMGVVGWIVVALVAVALVLLAVYLFRRYRAGGAEGAPGGAAGDFE